jgi:hypothetical protein
MASLDGCGRRREPAWHRRERRVRSGQRLLAQVSAACAKLAGHHGSEPPAILRPLLDALSLFAPRPSDVPWPYSLVSMGSHRSPKPVLMPSSSIDIPVVVVASVVASSSSTSSTLVRGILAGDFRSLPVIQWRGLHARFASSSSQVAAFRALVLEMEVSVRAVRCSSEQRKFSEPEILCVDKCFKLIQFVLDDCPNWAPGVFHISKGAFLEILGNGLAELHNLTSPIF